jgi:hypothetical protein
MNKNFQDRNQHEPNQTSTLGDQSNQGKNSENTKTWNCVYILALLQNQRENNN